MMVAATYCAPSASCVFMCTDQGAEGAYLGHHVFAASFLRRASRARSGCLPLGTRPCPFSAWGGQGSQEPQPKGPSQCCIPYFTKWHMPASDHPNPAHFLLGCCPRKWLACDTVFPGCPIENLPERTLLLKRIRSQALAAACPFHKH